MHDTTNYGDAGDPLTPAPPKSSKVKAWELLLEIAPEISSLIKHDVRFEPRPPLPVGRAFFLQLLACLTDPLMRSIIQRLACEMVDDHVKDRIRSYITEDQPWDDSES